MNKNRHIIGELQEFFASNDSSKAINSISIIMNSIRIQSKVIGSVKNPNCKFTCLQVLQLLVLFPFFSIKNAANYSSSALGRMFVCHKDMFYRFMNDGKVNCRRFQAVVFTCETQNGIEVGHQVRHHRWYGPSKDRIQDRKDWQGILSYPNEAYTRLQGNVPLLYRGVPQFLLDFSLHVEMGKRSDKPRGYPRNRRRPAIAGNTRRMNVLSDVALSILQVRLRRPSVCSNAQS